MRSAHIRETLYCFGEVFNGFVRITVFDTVPDTVLDVSLQNNLSAAVQGGFCGIDLRQNIFAGDILVESAVCQAGGCVCHAILIANSQNATETEETCC